MIAGPETQVMTVYEFVEQRGEMPECGQWTELHSGRPMHLEPPDIEHGTVVLNFSKELASFFQGRPAGYACFDLGLWLHEAPDAVLFPAIAIFLAGPRFGESDQVVTKTVPNVVVEIVSTADRRQQQGGRVELYLSWGIESVWQVDPAASSLVITSQQQSRLELSVGDLLHGVEPLPTLSFSVAQLFAIPDWYR